MSWDGRHRAGRRSRRALRRTRRMEVPQWDQLGMRDPGLDPPSRSLSEGRGLPYTRLYRALLPYFLVAGAVVTVLAFAAGFLFG